MNGRNDKEEQRLLDLLDAVGRNSDLSQRHLARHMGVALGLANSYLKRCIRKGLIKISEAPANRYLYYLTPQGFSEKSRLTAKYLSTSFEFYRQASESCGRTLRECRARSWVQLLFCGVSDLAEIAALRALELDMHIVGTYDPTTERKKFLGQPVWRSLQDIGQFDAALLTDLTNSRESYERLRVELGRERLLVPDILRL
jgi:DNA-binding MarR family transcriptional regulator